MIDYIDNFFNYASNVNVSKLLRIFWFFFFFEFTRFFLFEFIVLIIWKLNEPKRKAINEEARIRFFIESPLISIIVTGKNEGKKIFKHATSLQ